MDRELAGVALGTEDGDEGGDKGAGEEGRDRGEEIEELEGSVAAASKVRNDAGRYTGSFFVVPGCDDGGGVVVLRFVPAETKQPLFLL